MINRLQASSKNKFENAKSFYAYKIQLKFKSSDRKTESDWNGTQICKQNTWTRPFQGHSLRLIAKSRFRDNTWLMIPYQLGDFRKDIISRFTLSETDPDFGSRLSLLRIIWIQIKSGFIERKVNFWKTRSIPSSYILSV